MNDYADSVRAERFLNDRQLQAICREHSVSVDDAREDLHETLSGYRAEEVLNWLGY